MSAASADDPPLALLLARGVARALAQRGVATLAEVALANGDTIIGTLAGR